MKIIKRIEKRPVTAWTVEIHEDWESVRESMERHKGMAYHVNTWSDNRWWYLKYNSLEV